MDFFLKCQVQLTGLEPSYWADILRSRPPQVFQIEQGTVPKVR